jgi:hypothetical protein
MFFSPKTKGFVVDRGKQVTSVARVSGFETPLVLETVEEFGSGDLEAMKAAFAKIAPGKRSIYLHANCGISPESRFVRRASLDLKRVKETGYLAEVMNTQFRIDPEHQIIAVLNAFDGTEYDASKANPAKEVFFCGMPIEVASEAQRNLLDLGVYPETLELSSVASLAAVIDYLRFSDSSKPTIVLELGSESTQSFIVSARGLEASRPIAVGLEAMVPVVQKELGLKDEESARKLFFSNTFDFTGMGASLCKRLLKELQSSMGFYEVQTGQSIGQLICTVLPSKLSWLEAVVAGQLGVNVLQPQYVSWLSTRKITLGPEVAEFPLDGRRFALLGLMMKFSTHNDAPAA